MLTSYTTYDDIRSALGVSSDELEDATLGLESWESHLLFELEDVNATLPAAYAGVVAIPTASRTAAQAKFYRATRLFATLAVANALTAALPMFGPKDISDGKATVSRFADSPYRATVTKIKEQYGIAHSRLKQALAEMSSTAAIIVLRPYMGISSPTTDPVVG